FYLAAQYDTYNIIENDGSKTDSITIEGNCFRGGFRQIFLEKSWPQSLTDIKIKKNRFYNPSVSVMLIKNVQNLEVDSNYILFDTLRYSSYLIPSSGTTIRGIAIHTRDTGI